VVAGLVGEMAPGLPGTITKQFSESDTRKAIKRSGIKESRWKDLVNALARAKNLLIIAGDDLLRNPGSQDSVNCLMNLHFVKSRTSRCQIMFLENEGSLTGGILSGMHPDYLPGFQSLKEKTNIQKWNKNWGTKLPSIKGLQVHDMIDNIREDGITALFITGHIPAHPNLKNLKFLVQCNMFMTDLSKSANVFLPLTYFLENEGHFLTLEGKLNRLRRVVPWPDNARPVSCIISDLASAMQEKGFESHQPRDLFRELSNYTELPFPRQKKDKQKLQPIKVRTQKEPGGPMEYNHYKYRGTDLVDLVDDLKKVTNV